MINFWHYSAADELGIGFQEMEVAALAVFICLIFFGFIFIASKIYNKCFLKDFLYYGNVEEGQMYPGPPEAKIIQGITIGMINQIWSILETI